MSSLRQRLYQKLIDPPEAASCSELTEAACRHVPGNFVRLVLSYFLTKLGDAVMNPKTTLTFAMSVVGAPVALTGLLVPIRESGSLIPQIALSRWFERFPVRKRLWSWGSVGQALFIFGIAASVWLFSGVLAGIVILALLAGFALSRAVCSVTSKDVIGKTIPKRQRGRTSGYSASLAGLATILVGLLLGLGLGIDEAGDLSRTSFAWLLVGAGSLWLLAAWTYSRVREQAAQPETEADTSDAGLGKLQLLISDSHFRRFVMTRALLISSALLGPYLVLLSRQRTDSGLAELGYFILAGGVASMISSPVWGSLSDRSSRNVLTVAAIATAALAGFTLAAEWLEWSMRRRIWFYPGLFFMLGIIHDGVRLGRSTYIVDMARGQQRTDYVAVSNTAIGLILLAAGLATAAVAQASILWVLGMLAVAAAVAAALSRRLPDVQGTENPESES